MVALIHAAGITSSWWNRVSDLLYLLSKRCACSVAQSFLTLGTPWTVAHQTPLSMGVFQAGILEWVTIPFSRGSSQPRNWTQVSWVTGDSLLLGHQEHDASNHMGSKILVPVDTNSSILALPHSHCLILALRDCLLKQFQLVPFSLTTLSRPMLADQSYQSIWLCDTAAQDIFRSLHLKSLCWHFRPSESSNFISLYIFHELCIPARLNCLWSS